MYNRTYLVRKYAAMCEATYNPNKAQQIISTHCKEPFQIISQDPHHLIIEFPSYIVLAFRGTQLTSPRDLINDLHVLTDTLSLSTTVQLDCEIRLKTLIAHNSKSETPKGIHLTGHSLGGSIARTLTGKYAKYITHSYLFNEGSGIQWPWTSEHHGLITGFFIEGDIISADAIFRRKTNSVFKPKPGLSAHTIKQFY